VELNRKGAKSAKVGEEQIKTGFLFSYLCDLCAFAVAFERFRRERAPLRVAAKRVA
jgi:hypothetical protein